MSRQGATFDVRTFFVALAAQGRVVHALLLREMQSRYGRDNIGILWIIVEPMLFATSITLLHTLGGYGHAGKGQQVYPFTVIGYCLFIIFRNTFNRSARAIDGSTSLLYHRMVTPFDIMLAKTIVDATGCISALVLLLSVGIMLGLADVPARPLYLVAATALIVWMTFGLSLIIATYTYNAHFVERLVHPFSYAMVPLSGAFVTMSFLPPWAREYMAWNPMMSIFEMARYGQFATATDDYVYSGFIMAACAGLMYWGLVAIRNMRRHINV